VRQLPELPETFLFLTVSLFLVPLNHIPMLFHKLTLSPPSQNPIIQFKAKAHGTTFVLSRRRRPRRLFRSTSVGAPAHSMTTTHSFQSRSNVAVALFTLRLMIFGISAARLSASARLHPFMVLSEITIKPM
jgi:hypothetical protein